MDQLGKLVDRVKPGLVNDVEAGITEGVGCTIQVFVGLLGVLITAGIGLIEWALNVSLQKGVPIDAVAAILTILVLLTIRKAEGLLKKLIFRR